MINSYFEENIIEVKDCKYTKNCDFSDLTTIKLSSTSNLCVVKTVEALKKVLFLAKKYKVSYRVLGLGANQIIGTNQNIVYIKLDLESNFDQIDGYCDEYNLSASIHLAKLTAHACKFGVRGFEVFTGIPGTLGGAVFMNAGTSLGEMSGLVVEVECLDKNGQLVKYKTDKSSFSYRKNHFLQEGDIIIAVKMAPVRQDFAVKEEIVNYLKYRNSTQPLDQNTCGCVFKNSSEVFKAGKCIDLLGLKGFSVNGIKVSRKHANFFENRKNCTYHDFMKLLNSVKDELYLQFGLRFDPEVRLP